MLIDTLCVEGVFFVEAIVAAIFGSIFSLFGGLIGSSVQSSMADQQVQANKDINDQNLAFAKEQNEINRQREDTAIQRSRKDAEAAGFSPLAGIGGASSTYASLPQAVAPDISGFASNIASIVNSSSSQISGNLTDIGNKLYDLPVRSLQLEGLVSENKKKSADASSAIVESIYNLSSLHDRLKSTKAKAALDDYITQRVKDLQLIPSGYSSGLPNIVKQALDGLNQLGDGVSDQLDETMKAVDKAKKGEKLNKDEKKRVDAYNDYRKWEQNTYPLPF